MDEPHHLRVADPVRREDHHLVLRVDEADEEVEERLLRARGDDHVLGREGAAVVLLGVGGDRALEPGRAVGGDVLDLAAGEARSRGDDRRQSTVDGTRSPV